MQKEKPFKLIALTFGILILVFLAAFYVIAWTEPGQTPPTGNAPAPLNVSATAQTKTGALTIAAGGGEAFVLRNGGDIRIYNTANSGSALLYVDNDGEIVTQGNLKAGSVSIKGDASVSTNLNSDKIDNYHAADFMAAGGGGGSVTLVGDTSSAPACPAGWIEAQNGYWNCVYSPPGGDCFCGSSNHYYANQGYAEAWRATAVEGPAGYPSFRCRICVK